MKFFIGPQRRRRRQRRAAEVETVKRNGRHVPVISIADLPEIDVRNLNELDEHDVIFAHQLATLTKDDLLALPNFGVKAVEQCRRALDAIGFEHPDWS